MIGSEEVLPTNVGGISDGCSTDGGCSSSVMIGGRGIKDRDDVEEELFSDDFVSEHENRV